MLVSAQQHSSTEVSVNSFMGGLDHVESSLTSIHEGSLQHPFRLTDVPIDVHPLHVPRVAWSNSKGTQNLFPNEGPPQEPFQLENDDSAVLALDQAESTTKLLELHVSGPKDQRVNLMFFSDGCELAHILLHYDKTSSQRLAYQLKMPRYLIRVRAIRQRLAAPDIRDRLSRWSHVTRCRPSECLWTIRTVKYCKYPLHARIMPMLLYRTTLISVGYRSTR